MSTSTRTPGRLGEQGHLGELLAGLSDMARRRDLTDSAWAEAAGLPKETLSRLRRRHNCAFSTLDALARAAGMQIGVRGSEAAHTGRQDHVPASIDRDYEQRLLDLALSGSISPGEWLALGPGFFMAGLAMLLASLTGFDRPRLVTLAERLHPGISEPAALNLWLERSPLRPDRFVPMLEQQRRHAA